MPTAHRDMVRRWRASRPLGRYGLGVVLLAGLAHGLASIGPLGTPRPRLRSTESADPLRFEPNRGQFEGSSAFVAYAGGYTVALTSTGATFDLGRPEGAAQAVQVRMELRGANPEAQMQGRNELPSRSHYFRGPDPARWQTDVPNYARVEYEAVYPGIDLVFHGDEERLEYDFVVAPRADAQRIRLHFEGAQQAWLDGNGDLLVDTPAGEIRQKKPVLYQDVEGERRRIDGGYALHGTDEVGFVVGAHDATRSLVIDPQIVYSTYVGGCRGLQGVQDVAVDAAGNAYVVGYHPAGCDREGAQAWVVRFTPEGERTDTALFGTAGGYRDAATGVAVDAAGDVYVTGWSDYVPPTGPPPFPTTPGAYQPSHVGGRDAFLTKLTPTLDAILYSTLFGGSGDDIGTDVAVDAAGAMYLVGKTASTDFPAANAAQPALAGGEDAFVAALDPAGSSLVFSTYLGGSGLESVARLAGTDSAVILAGTTSSPDLPVQSGDPAGPFQASFGGGGSDAFVAGYSPSGTQEFLTYLGGSGRDEAFGVATDVAGFAYVTGGTASEDYPTLNPVQANLSFPPEGDAFATKLCQRGASLIYSTYLEVRGDVGSCAGLTNGTPCGGIAVGPEGEAFVTAKGVFAAKLDASGSNRVYTFNGFGGNAIVKAPSGELLVTGKVTFSPASQLFPTLTTGNAYQDWYETEVGTLAKMTDGPNPGAGFEQHDERLTYTGEWETDFSPEHSGGSAARSMEPGATVVLTFNGTGIQLIGERGPSSGTALVSLDGDFFRQDLPLDTYASPSEPRSLLLSFSHLPAGDHTLTVEVEGTPGSRSTGSWVSIDGFNVLGPPPPSPSPSPSPTPTPTPSPTPTPTPTPSPSAFPGVPLPIPLPSLFPSPRPSLLPLVRARPPRP